MAPGSRAIALMGIAAAGVAGAVASVILAVTSGHVDAPALQAALFNWVTLSYLVSGLVAWRRRPANHFGPLMIVAGFLTCLSNLAWSDVPLLFTVGQAVDLLPLVIFLHVFLAFPDGRLGGRVARGLVGAGYLIGFGGQLVVMLLGGFGSGNLLAVVDAPELANSLHTPSSSSWPRSPFPVSPSSPPGGGPPGGRCAGGPRCWSTRSGSRSS